MPVTEAPAFGRGHMAAGAPVVEADHMAAAGAPVVETDNLAAAGAPVVEADHMAAAESHAAEPEHLAAVEIPVRVKLCGNCNPYTDAGIILGILRQAGGIRILFDGDTNGKVLLSINGCDRACTAGFAGSTGLIVNGWNFEGITYRDERALAGAVLDVLYRCAEKC